MSIVEPFHKSEAFQAVVKALKSDGFFLCYSGGDFYVTHESLGLLTTTGFWSKKRYLEYPLVAVVDPNLATVTYWGSDRYYELIKKIASLLSVHLKEVRIVYMDQLRNNPYFEDRGRGPMMCSDGRISDNTWTDRYACL